MRKNNFLQRNILSLNPITTTQTSNNNNIIKFNSLSSTPTSNNSTLFSSSYSSKISTPTNNEFPSTSSSKSLFIKQNPLSLLKSSPRPSNASYLKIHHNTILNETTYTQLISPSPTNKTFPKLDLLSFIISPFLKNKTCICDLRIYQNNKLFTPYFKLLLNTNNYVLLTAEKASHCCSISFIYNIYLIYNNHKHKIGFIKANIRRNIFMIYEKKRNSCLYMGRIVYSNCSFLLPCKDKEGQMEVEIPDIVVGNDSKMYLNEFDSVLTSRRSLKVTTRNPMWVDYKHEYVMNFTERVRLASKSNFILTYNEDNILQVGKSENKVYALDFMFPLSPFQAFCIGISSIISNWKFIW